MRSSLGDTSPLWPIIICIVKFSSVFITSSVFARTSWNHNETPLVQAIFNEISTPVKIYQKRPYIILDISADSEV
jgi:hypothetical protein